MKYFFYTALILAILFSFSGVALAAFPSTSQGDQYTAVNATMFAAAAAAGISPDTFVSIYDTAAVDGDLSGFSASELAAACQVLSSLSGFQSVLVDYNTVFSNLNCGTRLAAGVVGAEAAGPSRAALPSTGVAMALLLGSGVVGLGAASRLIKRSN